MPHKIRELIADARHAGFALDHQGDNANTYQERQVTKAIADFKSGE